MSRKRGECPLLRTMESVVSARLRRQEEGGRAFLLPRGPVAWAKPETRPVAPATASPKRVSIGRLMDDSAPPYPSFLFVKGFRLFDAVPQKWLNGFPALSRASLMSCAGITRT